MTDWWAALDIRTGQLEGSRHVEEGGSSRLAGTGQKGKANWRWGKDSIAMSCREEESCD